ncbi:MAG TPA: hypothetical protein PKY77_08175 [Phycisphaerae bacterium]|nr:hypothetical protein [Phycisphaerae bacterium]HRY68668.1 hypothetical protein [Phycisphaerae bacterium]HSA25494.1 hypothetical protein [Phycisphaerae bacterium]
MTPETKRNAVIAVTVVAVAVAAWMTWGYLGRAGASGVEGRIELKVFCDQCKYTADAELSELTPPAGGKAARAPIFGPGYKCPKCGKETLYANPYVCTKCQTLFLMSKGASGAPERKCPKCGEVQ